MRWRWSVPFTFMLVTLMLVPGMRVASGQEDEVAIRALVQRWVEVNRKDDINGILALFASDAAIDSLVAGGKVSKDRYAGAMKQAQATGRLASNHEARITSLTMRDADRADVTVDLEWDAPGASGREQYKAQWTLVKREGRWMFLDTQYLGQPLEIDEAMLGLWEGLEVNNYGGRSVEIEIKKSGMRVEVYYNMGGTRGATAKSWRMRGKIVSRDTVITTTSQGYQHSFTLIDRASLKFENNFSGGKLVTVLRKVR